jgi:hypothetical protein
MMPTLPNLCPSSKLALPKAFDAQGLLMTELLNGHYN